MKTLAGTNITAGVGSVQRLIFRGLSGLSILPVRTQPAMRLMAAAMLTFVFSALLVPRTADAMSAYLSVISANHPGSKVGNLCANCHTNWSGSGPGTSWRIDYLLYTAAGGVVPPISSPVYLNDQDNDGANANTEFINSQSASRPPLPNRWFPAYPDKDGDGCLQLLHSLGEKGVLEAPTNVAASGYIGASSGFISYGPQGWDMDDNDNLQGCSTAWPTTATAGTFNNPGTSTDVTNPAAITDFRANGLLTAAIPLVWTATGDDGTTGAAHSYDLKYTTATLAAASLNCGAGSSACNVRDPAHWAQMYNFAESGDALTPGWNAGNPSAPLMRALYEPVPTAPGAMQACNTLGQNCTASPGASYILSSKGIIGSAILPTNVITNGTTYWLAVRTSDGVTRPSGTLTAPGTITDNASLSNIIAVTAGPAGTGAAISSVSPTSLTGAQAQAITITANGFGLNSTQAAQMVLTNSTGAVQVSLSGLTWPANGVTGSIQCTALLGLNGTYNLELRTAASVTKAAWVNAITINNILCPDAPSGVISVNPSSRGQGATNQSISISGTGFTGATAVSFGAGVTVNSFVVNSATSITANITVAAAATVGTRSVTATTALGTSGPNALFSVTQGPTITSSTPPSGIVGTAYSYTETATGGSAPYAWNATGLPAGLSINSSTGVISGTPTTAGTFVGSVTVTDTNAGTSSQATSIVISIGASDVDLVMTAVSTTASAVGAGNSFVIDSTEANQGATNNTVANTVMFYLSLDNMITSADIALTGSRVVDSLAAGASSYAATVVTVPLTVVPGAYYIGAIADATSLVVETNETNNALSSTVTIIVIRDVDLVMTAVSTTTSSVAIGTMFVIDSIEANIGTTNMTAANNVVSFYLSLDSVVTTSDIELVSSRTVTALPDGASSAGSTSAFARAATPSGTYYLGACADVTNLQPETNESNNCLASAATITIIGSITVPGAPTIGTATAGNASASVTFTAPVNNGGSAITSYTATSSPGGITGTCTASPCTVNGLTNGVAYTFTVTATNAVGTGPASAASNSVTPQESVPPSVPTKLTTTAFSTTQINLTWRASTDNVGVTGYKVYRNGVQVGAPTGTSFSDTGLTAATSYKYTVAACDAAGNCSAQSATVTGTTKRK